MQKGSSYIFNEKTDKMFEKLLDFKYQLKNLTYAKFAQNKKVERGDLPELNFKNEELEPINKCGRVQFKYTLFSLSIFLSGITYCVMHTKKLYKLQVPLKKSLYSWGALFVIFVGCLKFIEIKFDKMFDDASEEKLIEKIFLTKEEDDLIKEKKKKLLKRQLETYKSIKFRSSYGV
jgi:hypothetical protein